MASYIIRRLLGAIPTLLVIVGVCFFMMRAAPGGPFDGERRLPPEIEANIKAAYDLDKPLTTQFVLYLGKVLQGDFGPSFKSKDFTVNELIAEGAPVSARLGLSAITIATIIGVTLGVFASLRQNTPGDYAVMTTAMVGITIPTFVVAPLLTLFLGVYAEWLPVAGWDGGKLINMILPVTVLALPQIAIIARLTRGSMIEVLRSNFVRTARAKGLSQTRVVLKHALSNALVPVVALAGVQLGLLLGGSIVIETIFALDGLGYLAYLSITHKDFPVTQAILLMLSVAYVLLTLTSDLINAWIDPRIRVH